MISLSTALVLTSVGLYLDGKTRLSRDLKFAVPGIKAKVYFKRLIADNNVSFYNRFEEICQRIPNAPAVIFEGLTYTWRDMEIASNKLAHWYQSKGIKPKDRVAMFMGNSPTFIISWLALLKIKAVAAFINNQLTGAALLHSLKTVDSRLLIFDYELIAPIEESLNAIRDMGYDIYTITPEEHVIYRHDEFTKDPSARFFGFAKWKHLSAEGFPKESRNDIDVGDAAALIFTSGTTGYPKAAVMDHGRCSMATSVWVGICKITDKDRIYNCLPLYHSAGSIIGIGQSWLSGSTVVLSRKFSTTNFWKEVREQDVTLIQYIGELCRYLMNAPEHPLDKANKVRLIYGNGLRPDIWKKFQERFGIDTVFEFYTMSEAASALLNINSGEDGAGAVGFRGPLARTFHKGLKLAKVDLETEELIKDKNGFCIECGPDEVGEMIMMVDNSSPQARYTGYYNQPKATNAKLIRNVFVKDDLYMRTGDVLYRSKDHFWYFADRAGDTFRWKGENVSTAEIADTIGRVEGIASCTVYGVSIAGQDGRAGMAAVVLKDEYWNQETAEQGNSMSESTSSSVSSSKKSGQRINETRLQEFVDRLGVYVNKEIPPYAIPRFIRICEKELEITGTFKNKKVDLKKEGFDLEKVKERLFWWSPQGHYLPFGPDEDNQIKTGRARL
ncbi:hypothetical protein BGZ76_001690 [Entomortierella beljakovae]|nr:hypothetical protein BGZ76_001690 [Entomortierella beljakovae]